VLLDILISRGFGQEGQSNKERARPKKVGADLDSLGQCILRIAKAEKNKSPI
jgi:hypothetical protein